ncbi:DUF2079 domain-containing protein [Rubrobacter indicoceani]|uniref:DUF2079 domain-containing protein n=1 Tax=Rubrobacter indicoceani TaxID=2051957 RepID=UPI000E5A8453|nr:DUF2079 domain-containing protein [Rubrobacter indicoceani]
MSEHRALFKKVREVSLKADRFAGDGASGGSVPSAASAKQSWFGPGAFVWCCAVLYGAVFSLLTIRRHETYSSARFDLANMDQAIWNSANGRILEVTGEAGENLTRLVNHADFLLLAYVPLYWLWESPYWLLVSQSLIVGLGAVPLYWLARRFIGRAWPAAMISAAYLFNPGLQSANTFDFHAQTLAPTFLLFAFHYLLARRLLPFVGFAVLASLCKEEISLMVAMMGAYVFVFERRFVLGASVLAAGFGYFALVMGVIIPSFNDGTTSELVEGRYGEVGGSMGGMARTLLTDPAAILGHALSGGKPGYILDLLGAGVFICLLAPGLLLIALPELAINLLSNRAQMSNANYHYSATIWPFVYLATAAGIAKITGLAGRLFSGRAWRDDLLKVLPGVLAFWVLLFGVYLDLLNGPVPVSPNYVQNPVVMRGLPDEYIANLDEAVAAIPDDPGVSVTASNWIAPHLAHRETLYLFPTLEGSGGPADYVVVDLYRASYFTGVDRQRGQRVLERLIEDPRYRAIYIAPNVTVFERTPG